jgi:hypothetical protein
VRVPCACGPVAVLELDEAHATLGESAGDQELSAKGLCLRLVQAVELARGGALGVQVHGLGHGLLHVEGELVALHARGECLITRVGLGGEGIEPMNELELGGLLAFGHGEFGLRKGERVLRVHTQVHGIEGGPQVVPIAGVEEAGADIDEGREVLGDRAQTIRHPRAERGHARLEHVASAVELDLRAVVVIGGPHAADEGDLIGAGADVGEPIADLHAALTVAFEPGL